MPHPTHCTGLFRHLLRRAGVVAALVLTLPGPLPARQAIIEDFGRKGTGPAHLVLIPCFSCRWQSFEPFMDRNLDRYTMLAVTLPGFGGSAVPNLPLNGPTPAWQEAAVDALERLILEQDLHAVTVVGHSLGGVFAPLIAERLGARVQRVILLDANPFSDRSWFKDDPAERLLQAGRTVEAQTANFAGATAWQRFNAPPSYADPDRRTAYHGWFMATPREVVVQYWRENSLADRNPTLAGLRVPVIDVKSLSPAIANTDSAKVDRVDEWRRNGRPAGLEILFLPRSRHYIMEEHPALLDRIVARATAGLPFCPRPADASWECLPSER